MSKSSKILSLEELNERVTKLKDFTERSMTQVEGMAKKKPVETTVMSLTIGIVIGVIIGASIVKR